MGNCCKPTVSDIPKPYVEDPISTIGNTLVKCSYCSTFESGPYIVLKCEHLYQQKCLSQWIVEQIDFKQALVIKCRVCGTKTSTAEIRKSNLPDRLNLLNSLFSKQLEILLKQLRKTPDFNNYQLQLESSKKHGDYYFFTNQNELEYDETPQ